MHKKKISSQCASYRFSRERSMTSVKHAWQFRIGEMKCLKCQYISPNLRYLHSPLYFPFRNFYWGVLKISQLISQSKKHEKPSMTTLPELSQIYLCPQFLGIGLKLFYSIWTILKYATVTRVSEFKWQTKEVCACVCVLRCEKKTLADPIIKFSPLVVSVGV